MKKNGTMSKWEQQAQQLEKVRAIRRLKRRAKRFKKLEKRYLSAPSRARGALLHEMVKVDQSKAVRYISKALLQREDMTIRSEALLALKQTPPGTIKATVMRSMLSPYVYERKALVELLISWGLKEGEHGLRELALDKSVSVRSAAIKGLGTIGGGAELLKVFALNGPDEGSAMVAARAWMDSMRDGKGTQESRIKVGLALLQANFKLARQIGVRGLTQEGQAVCQPLTEATYNKRGHVSAIDAINVAMWAECQDHLLSYTKLSQTSAKVTLLESIARWGVSGSKVDRFIKQQLSHPVSEVRVAVVKATSASNKGDTRFKRLDTLRVDQDVSVRCEAAMALTQRGEPEPLPEPMRVAFYKQLKETLQAHIPEPQSDTVWLECALRAIERLGVADFDLLITQAYSQWRRSIAFTRLRLQVIKAAARSPGPARLEVLMEGMLDRDLDVKRLSEESLRNPPR